MSCQPTPYCIEHWWDSLKGVKSGIYMQSHLLVPSAGFVWLYVLLCLTCLQFHSFSALGIYPDFPIQWENWQNHILWLGEYQNFLGWIPTARITYTCRLTQNYRRISVSRYFWRFLVQPSLSKPDQLYDVAQSLKQLSSEYIQEVRFLDLIGNLSQCLTAVLWKK